MKDADVVVVVWTSGIVVLGVVVDDAEGCVVVELLPVSAVVVVEPSVSEGLVVVDVVGAMVLDVVTVSAAPKNGSDAEGWSVTPLRTAPTAADAMMTARAVATSQAPTMANLFLMPSVWGRSSSTGLSDR